LKYWLDPTQSNATFVNGYDPSGGVPIQVDPIASAVGGVSGTFCSAEVTPTVTLANGGAITLTAVTITYGFDGNNNLTYNWTGSLAQWQSTTVTLPTVNLSNGVHTFNAVISNPNTGVDENNLNNAQNSTLNVVLNGQAVVLDLTLDCYGSETSWELQNATGTVIYSGSGYLDDAAGLVTETWCLDFGCYAYIIEDSYGDGIYGLPWCDSSGNVVISSLGDSLTGISADNSDFGDSETLNFCVTGGGLDALNQESIKVYPNPSTDVVNWVSSAVVNSYAIVDLQGKKVLVRQNVHAAQFQVSIANLSPGVYVLQGVFEDGKTGQVQVIKH
jgi:hypothetical protein